ncbi:histidine phosphatase family protein [Kibdelosporangium persicum]|uniref:Alpha-ribazole phosphatase n=1 Tax=Kibdelosporangium persicum TaxID=2698649 RepID=A0ABX2F7A0_9PSEU|nr:histidine phosphatase family protein [Kibdelosporangium persicum]NRN67147.1 Alpha-ribazole phosphatase [Kibdelosporangium persicum]
MSARLLLVRHAETLWHQDNRYAGARSNPGLSANGLRQVESLAKGVASEGVEVVASSPMERALRTATPAAEALGLTVQVVPSLHEADFGELEGRTIAEMDPELVRQFRADPVANVFPEAEPPAEAAARAVAALRELNAEHDGHTVLVVAHSTLLRLALCSLLGLPLSSYRRVFPRLENVQVTEIKLPADPAEPAALLSLNRVIVP